MRLFDPKLFSNNQTSNYDHMGTQVGGNKHFGNPVTEVIDNTSELASTNIEQQSMPVTDETA